MSAELKGTRSENSNMQANQMVEKKISGKYERKEYEKFIVSETPEIIQQLTEFIMSSYSQEKELKEAIKGLDDGLQKELLKSGQKEERKSSKQQLIYYLISY